MSQAEAPATKQKSVKGPPVQLVISKDKMFITLLTTLAIEQLRKFKPKLSAELSNIGVKDDRLINEALEKFSKAVESDNPVSKIELLQGTPMVAPVHGYISWSRAFFEKGFEVDPETGAVDYRRHVAKTSVEKDELLGQILSPEPGNDGVDVFGNIIPAGSGQDAEFKSGPNIRLEENKLYAEISGRVEFLKGTLSVDDVYTVDGNVGLRTGHISHTGAVIVVQDIEPESVVEAKGSVDVGGYIEQASVTAGGDLNVVSSIIGDEKSFIRVEGNIQTSYMKQANIECTGDVLVTNSIENCIIKTQGAVIVSQGRIVGGEIIALGGVEAPQIGSEAHVQTFITVGKDFRSGEPEPDYESEIEELNINIAEFEAQIKTITDRAANITGPLKEKMTHLLFQADESRKRITELEALRDNQDGEDRAKNKIIVREKFYPGVTATLRHLSQKYDRETSGPFMLAIREGDIQFINRVPNSIKD